MIQIPSTNINISIRIFGVIRATNLRKEKKTREKIHVSQYDYYDFGSLLDHYLVN